MLKRVQELLCFFDQDISYRSSEAVLQMHTEEIVRAIKVFYSDSTEYIITLSGNDCIQLWREQNKFWNRNQCWIAIL